MNINIILFIILIGIILSIKLLSYELDRIDSSSIPNKYVYTISKHFNRIGRKEPPRASLTGRMNGNIINIEGEPEEQWLTNTELYAWKNKKTKDLHKQTNALTKNSKPALKAL